jgi:mono/diheme cytochrome c family protein
VARRRIMFWTLFLATSLVVYLLVTVYHRLVPESSPVARGGATPGIYVCLSCHGKNDDDAPEAWSLSCERQSVMPGHPDYEGSCEDLLAFFAAARVRSSFAERLAANTSNRLLAGERLARMFYCFQCHGELGQGGFPNDGALKGYVPGYFGEDFRRLTNDASPAAVRAWINDGINPDLLNSPIEGPVAAFVIEHQAIQMPQFNSLTHSKIDLLVNYVLTLHAFGPMDAGAVRTYDKLTRLPSSLNRKHDLLHKAEPSR